MRWPYLPACSAQGGVPGPGGCILVNRGCNLVLGGVPGLGEWTWSLGVYLVPWGCTWSRGVYLVLGGCTWSQGVYLSPMGCTWSRGVYLVLGGVPGPGGVCLVPGGVPGPRGYTWPGSPPPRTRHTPPPTPRTWSGTTPVNRITDACKNITLPKLRCGR